MLFFLCFSGKFCSYQILIRNPLGQFTGFLQNVLQQVKTVFLKDNIGFPGVLRLVTFDNSGDIFQRGFFKLGLNNFGNFFRGVGIDVINAFLDGMEQRPER